MPATQVGATETFSFDDGDSGHACVLADGPPTPGQTLLLFANSNTVITAVSSGGGAAWVKRVDATDQQGAYWWELTAAGGETDTVTVTTNGNHQAQVQISRWDGIDAYSDGGFERVNNVNSTALPDGETNILATSTMLVVVGAALHNFDGELAVDPVWSDGFTALGAAAQGAPATGQAVVGFTGYTQPVGVAPVPVDVVTWTHNARNRYALWIAYTTTESGTTVPVGPAEQTDQAQPVTATRAAAVAAAAEADTAHPFTPAKPRPVTLAAETDAALPVAWAPARLVTTAAEADAAYPLTSGRTLRVGAAGQADTAQPLTPASTRLVARAAQTDQALPVGFGYRVTVTTADQADTAHPLTSGRTLRVGAAGQVDTAQPLTGLRATPIGRAAESDQALPITATGGLTPVPARGGLVLRPSPGLIIH